MRLVDNVGDKSEVLKLDLDIARIFVRVIAKLDRLGAPADSQLEVAFLLLGDDLALFIGQRILRDYFIALVGIVVFIFDLDIVELTLELFFEGLAVNRAHQFRDRYLLA